MCNLRRSLESKSFTGSKVVAVRKSDGKYYSVAMGFRYRKNGRVPVVKTQRRISHHFADTILLKDGWDGYTPKMEGRTAVFKYRGDAVKLLQSMLMEKKSSLYRLEVKKAKVSNDLIDGTYGIDPVIAGRRIEFLE